MRRHPSLSNSINDDVIATPSLVEAIVSRSYDLEHLSVSLMIDAGHFFDSCQPGRSWRRLRTLTLTSRVLEPMAHHEDICDLLRSASLAALQMPRLERMVIWNSSFGDACAGIYRREKANRLATFTWRGTWDLELSHEVVQSWKDVGSELCCLRVVKEQVHGDVKGHGSAIHRLRLPNGVIDPVSLWQLRREDLVEQMT